MYNSGGGGGAVVTSNPGCYYYPFVNSNVSNLHAQHEPQGHHAAAPHHNHREEHAGIERTYYQATAPIQNRNMISPDLAPDLRGVGSDVQFYESEECKKEASYYNLQPAIASTPDQYNIQPNNTGFDFYYTNPTNDDLAWDPTPSDQNKLPAQWTTGEVIDWLMNWARQNGVDIFDINMKEYNRMSGQEFCNLNVHQFISLDPQYGSLIYQALQNEINQSYMMQPSLLSLEIPTTLRQNNPLPAFHTWSNDTFTQIFNVAGSDIQGSSPSSSHDSDREDRESTSSSMSTANEKPSQAPAFLTNSPCTDILEDKKGGRRGRPPKGESRSSRNRQGKGNGKLWEFIRDLLLDPATNPSLIRWERPEDGIFKFVQSDRVAKMWGDRKQNPRMTYEKLSRAMRYYYKSQVLLPVFGRRLVYKFGPNATGWRHGPGFH